MATSPELVRSQLTALTTATAAELLALAEQVAPGERVRTVLDALPILVPAYYDAAGTLAVAWYDELRAEATPAPTYAPAIIGAGTTDWIEREVEQFSRSIQDAEDATRRILDETTNLASKEVARGFRRSITGNAAADPGAVGWKRMARPGACKFCLMLADRGAVYREDTAQFAAHKHCHCIAGPEFGGDHIWREAKPMQYVASSKRPKDPRRLAERNAKVRAYLNDKYPDAPG